jgi:glutathione-independent formaldehyde dehydrogenase
VPPPAGTVKKAVVYRGPRQIAVEERPDPKIQHPSDAIVRITTTNICGSDLHMYEGRTSVEEGKVLGHENMGIVEAVGDALTRIKVGDRVSVPFNIACGTCRNCISGWTSFCLRTNPTEGMDGAAYGYANMGPYDGGQAEFLRVPYADFNLLELPAGSEHENDFTMLSDVFPTGYHATELAQVSPGRTVAIFGAGPVGLMAAHSANLRGASQTFVVDFQPDRLALAERMGATAINAAETDDVVAAIMDATDEAKQGRIAFDYGTAFTKGISIGSGQCPVKRYNRQLRDLIIRGQATPSLIVSHELSLDDAVQAYDQFDKRVDGWTKVLLHPGTAA